ncbi:hypothetical protein C0J52_22404 [Blattella germanica]|nr:hypothetical protein C0J52_22404 [Blattella germanica]
MRTVQRVCKEASVSTEPSPKFSSPRITVKRKCYVTALSDSEKDIIRSEINDFTKDGECPTRAKLREILRDKVGYSGSLTSVARIVKDLGLEYRKYDGKRVLMQVRTSPVASSEYITVSI